VADGGCGDVQYRTTCFRRSLKAGAAAGKNSAMKALQNRWAARGGRLLAVLAYLCAAAAAADSVARAQEATPADQLQLIDGFVGELVYTVPREQGSWVSVTCDPRGRLIASDQYGRLYRITPGATEPTAEGVGPAAARVEQLSVNTGRAHGLLCAFDSLYVMAHAGEGQPSGLYRARDTNNDDQYDRVDLLRSFDGEGEHGPHAVVLAPDGRSLVVCCGNHTKLVDVQSSLVPRLWREDLVLERMWDAGGHAVGILAPGGWICRTDPDGRQWQLISIGYRNQYDVAFNATGDLFTYDSDMEWDIGTPWYRPTRVCHVTPGSEFGWRSGTGNWPAYYHDSLPPAVEIGVGSPTGMTFGTEARFPARYRNALLMADWSYGVIYAVHLRPEGGSYSGEFERFCSAPALPVADMVVNPHDGALYFVVGGRRVQSALYRIVYRGPESTEPAAPEPLNAGNQRRREIENWLIQAANDPRAAGPAAIQAVWPALAVDDRFVRFAARTTIEHTPVDAWADAALAETDPRASLEALTALARAGRPEHQAPVIRALARLDWETLDEAAQMALLRTYGLVLCRLGTPTDETRHAINQRFGPLYPSPSRLVNRELLQLLVAVDSPTIVPAAMRELAQQTTQEEQIQIILCLRLANQGWTPELRQQYFQWFLDSARLQGGNSFSGFLANIRQVAIDRLPPRDRAGLAPLLRQQPTTSDPYAELRARPFVKKWTVDELVAIAERGLVDRDYENGRQMFALAQCYKCHRMAGEGAMVGPDVTAAGHRYNLRDLIATLVEPDREISDQYRATKFALEDGRVVAGRVVNLVEGEYLVMTDMLQPGRLERVPVDEILEQRPSQTSVMPSGLLDNLTESEILDLLAYLRSSGDPEFSEFRH
jgi:putative heme-binding domain-containing protein